MKQMFEAHRGWFIGCIVIVFAVYVRVSSDSYREYNIGVEKVEANQTAVAIGHLRRAARSYVPFGDLGLARHTAALDQLKTIGFKAEESQSYAQALSAWRSIRAALLGSRSFFTPFPDRLNEANAHIAHIMTLVPKPPIDANKSNEVLEAEHMALLKQTRRPHSMWGGTAIVSLIGFLWMGYRFASQLEQTHDPATRKKNLKTLAISVSCMLLFFTALYLA